jgi:transposase
MNRSPSSASRRVTRTFFVHKPRGEFHARVESVGPQHFGIVCVDCAKARSKFLFVDFFGKVLIPPTVLEHQQSEFEAAHNRINEACRQHQIKDRLIAIERTGLYHAPVQRFFRSHDWDVRLVHPYASRQCRLPVDPGNKTDDTDLAAIFRATINGFGLVDLPWSDPYRALQFLARQRRDLVTKSAILQCQIREVLHYAMPGYADCFGKFWESTAALPIACQTGSAQAIRDLGLAGLRELLSNAHVRPHPSTLPKVLAWANDAPPSSPDHLLLRSSVVGLNDDRLGKIKQIQALERQCVSWLVQTPFLLLIAIPGINVVSAAELAGEMGPPQGYANANNITGRAGLMPSRYQSDTVDRPGGPLRRAANRRLRFALLQIADNLIRHNHHYNVRALQGIQAKKDRRWIRIKIAKMFSRLAFIMLVNGRIYRHPCCCQTDSSILDKLLAFHREHDTPWQQMRQDLDAATTQLPRSRYAQEHRTLAERLGEINDRRRPGPQPLGDIISLVLARLTVVDVQSEGTREEGLS